MSCEAAVSRSSSDPSATVTTPRTGVDGEAAAGVVVQRVSDGIGGGVRIGSEGGHADHGAVGGVFVDGVGRGIRIADRSRIELVDVGHGDRERAGLEAAIGAGGSYGDRAAGAVRFAVDRTGDGHDAGAGVDRKASAIVIVQRVGDRVAAVGIVREGGNAHRRTDRCVFGDAIRRGVVVDDRRDARLVDVGDRDSVALRRGTAVGAGSPHRDAVAGVGFVIQSRVDGDFTRAAVDGEASAGIVVQCVGDGVGGGVGIGRLGRDADRVADRGIFGYRIRRGIRIADGRDVELIDIVQGDGVTLRGARAIGTGGPHGDVVRSGGFAIQQRTIGHGHDTGAGVDGEASRGVVVQRVGDRIGGGVRVGSEGSDANDGAIGRVLVDGVGRGIRIADGRDVEFIDIVQGDRVTLLAE